MVSERELVAANLRINDLQAQMTRLQADSTAELEKHREERDTLRAEAAMLREALTEIYDIRGELNPNNYDHEDVVKCNAAAIDCVVIARTALSTPGSDWLAKHDAEKDAEIAHLQDALHVAANQYSDDLDKRDATIAGLRRLLFLQHPCNGKYGDDGEMQCGSCLIDFKRNPVDVIDSHLQIMAENRLACNARRDASIRRKALIEARTEWLQAHRTDDFADWLVKQTEEATNG
jgi:hypothetical protein